MATDRIYTSAGINSISYDEDNKRQLWDNTMDCFVGSDYVRLIKALQQDIEWFNYKFENGNIGSPRSQDHLDVLNVYMTTLIGIRRKQIINDII